MNYLMIENEGTTDLEALTLMGVSTSRNNSDLIGKFGTGSKKGITLLLRQGIPVNTFIGNLRAEYFSEPIKINGSEFNQVCMKLTGKTPEGKQVNRVEKLGWVLEDGVIDWNDSYMALREFVANALDATNHDLSKVKIEIVDESKVRVKNGGQHTRIFVGLDYHVEFFYNNLNKFFLHFVGKQHKKVMKNTPLNRISQEVTGPEIYYCGVYLCSMGGYRERKTLFNFNFGKHDLNVGESRTVSTDDIQKSISTAMIKMDEEHIGQLMDTWLTGIKTWEGKKFDYYLVDRYIVEAHADKWRKCWASTFTDKHVPIPDDSVQHELTEIVERKGYIPVVVPNYFYSMLRDIGLPDYRKLINYLEALGYKVSDNVPESVKTVYNKIWEALTPYNRGKKIPQLKMFSTPFLSTMTLGQYKEDVVYLNTCLVNDTGNVSEQLKRVILEELGHHISSATDNSRDFQNFFMEIITATLLCCV